MILWVIVIFFHIYFPHRYCPIIVIFPIVIFPLCSISYFPLLFSQYYQLFSYVFPYCSYPTFHFFFIDWSIHTYTYIRIIIYILWVIFLLFSSVIIPFLSFHSFFLSRWEGHSLSVRSRMGSQGIRRWTSWWPVTCHGYGEFFRWYHSSLRDLKG